MKTKKIFLILVLAVLTINFSSCKKSESAVALSPNQLPLITTRTFSRSGSIVELRTQTYDGQGRLTSVNATGNYGGFSFQDIYTPSSITETYPNGGKTVYNLNAQGYIGTWIENDAPDYINHTLTYNSDGYLVKDVAVHSAYTSTTNGIYTWSNGNLVSLVENNFITTYTYTNFTNNLDEVEVQPLNFTVGNSSFHGKQSKNLISTETTGPVGSIGTTCTYTYEFDSQNRVSKKTMTVNSGGTYQMYSGVYTYTY